MELSEQVTALTAENKNKELIIQNILIETKALTKMHEIVSQDLFEARKEILIKDNAINDLNKQIQDLLKENESLKNSLQALQSEAQSGC